MAGFILKMLSLSVKMVYVLSKYIRRIWNKRTLHLLLIYFNNKPLYVSSRLDAHHQEVQLYINSNWYSQHTYDYTIAVYTESILLFFLLHYFLIKVFYLPTDAQQSCFKRILKFTLKQLLHVSVQSPSSGSVLFELAKVIVIKIIS